jgi:tRNA (cmo5U34)-methyltransferase
MKIERNWSFESNEVAENFDIHVREQLPWYDLATDAIAHITRHYLSKNGTVYDIGASTGNIGNSINSILRDRKAKFIAIESSKEMAQKYKGPGNLICSNVMDVEFVKFDVAICFLTLMFLSKTDRKKLINTLRENVKKGGAIIIFDKEEASQGYLATVMWRLTLAGKIAASVKPKDIIAKELSLSGVQRPIDKSEINDFEKWFKFGEFTGWIIEG